MMRPSIAINNIASVVFLLGNFLLPNILAHHMETQISLYYETLCPDSRRFFLKQLYPTYEKLNRYIDIELVPFGNANVSYPRHDNRPEFNCQHGPRECYGNRIQACVIDIVKNTDHTNTTLSIRYVHCMFQQDDWKNINSTAQRCAEMLQLNWQNIKKCADGEDGERLLIAHSLRTFNLVPEHTYVPWIVIDKNHTDEMQTNAENNLLKYLCDHHFNHEPQLELCKREMSLEQKANSAAITFSSSTSILFLMCLMIISSAMVARF